MLFRSANPEDERWRRWKEEYIGYNQSGAAQTFVVVCESEPVGEGTLLFSPDCRAISGRTTLADGTRTTNINALRIEKAYEGQGHISALVKLMEREAKKRGYSVLTIGVDASETRNLAIYLHFGYTRFVFAELEAGEFVLYYAKAL